MRLRPLPEIIGRAAALKALFAWVSAPERAIPGEKVTGFVSRNELRSHLTDEEREVIGLAREEAHATHVNAIGWRLENMWPLAWIVGFDAAPPIGGMIDDERIAALLQFLPRFDSSVTDFTTAAVARPVAEVDALEDLFYCAHNAVRSAQLGGNTVPRGFDPVGDGGVVHERRHALTWALSPGVGWDDTDLST